MSSYERRVKAADRVGDHMEMKELKDALDKRDAEIKSFAEKASAEIKDHGKILDETKSALEKLTEGGSEMSDRLVAVEQKLARRSFGGSDRKSIGEEFVELPAFKSMQDSQSGTVRMNVKSGATITSATTDAPGSVGDGVVPHRVPGVVTPGQREMTIRQLLMPGTTSSNSIEYVVEKGFNNNAASVAENPQNPKPKSDIQFETKVAPVKTIAHWFAASKQILSDLPMLQSYINTRALYGLAYKSEEQILAGDGQGQDMLGLIPQASLFKQSVYSKVDDTMIDTIRRASLQVRVAEYRPTFVVLNPEDWAGIETTKDKEDRYIEVSIRSGGEMRIWRLNVVETTAISAGQFLVGASLGAQVWDREQAAVQVSTQHDDFFTRNLVAILAEERLALTVYRPESFVRGHFGLGDSPSLND